MQERKKKRTAFDVKQAGVNVFNLKPLEECQGGVAHSPVEKRAELKHKRNGTVPNVFISKKTKQKTHILCEKFRKKGKEKRETLQMHRWTMS